jgi:hypothetical protein
MSLTLVQQQLDDVARIASLGQDDPDPGGVVG